MIGRLVVFLLLNFGALALGGIFTSAGVNSDWYKHLEKAPWTLPGWVFGLAWTLIMVCLAIYMAYLFDKPEWRASSAWWYALQLVLNIAWNPLFFKYHQTGLALFIIVLLSITVMGMFVMFYRTMNYQSFLLVPYILWLVIATSLNAYIQIKNE